MKLKIFKLLELTDNDDCRNILEVIISWLFRRKEEVDDQGKIGSRQ